MLGPAQLSSLVGIVNEEADGDRALDRLVEAVLLLTGSRNAMIARLNDERGTLELRHGAGRDWTIKAYSEHIRIGDFSGEGIVASVAASGSTFVSGNVQADPRYRNLFGSQSEIAAPIKDRHSRIRGVMNVESDERDRYDQEDVIVCEAAASIAALVLEREDILAREEALVQIGSALDRAATEDDLIQRVLRIADEVLRFQSCSIFLYDKASGQYYLRGSVGPLKQRVGSVAYRAGEGCTGWVCEHRTPLRLDQPQKDPRWRGIHLEIDSDLIASYLAVPIVSRQRSIGALRVLRRSSDNPYLDTRFTESDQRILQTIADQMASGLENIRSLEKTVQVERMAAWGELSAKSSHMIGNRVFAIKGDVNELGHLINENPLDIEAIRQIHRSLGTNVTRIEELLQDFRDFVMATHVSLVRADLNFLVTEAVVEVFPRRSPIGLVLDLDERIPEVEIDPRKLRRAISELVENSLNFFSEGTLTVRTGRAAPGLVKRARLREGHPYVYVEIADQGPGVPESRKEQIFTPFYSSRVKGMGLGLSIVKGIAEAHGGTVIEIGKEKKGARFVIILPAPGRKRKRK
jgi:signal transduction histidine kinase